MSNSRVVTVASEPAANSCRAPTVRSALGAHREHRAHPCTRRAGGQHRGQAAGRGDTAGRQHRHRHRVEHPGQQRQGADPRFAVPAALGASGHQDIDARVDRAPGARRRRPPGSPPVAPASWTRRTQDHSSPKLTHSSAGRAAKRHLEQFRVRRPSPSAPARYRTDPRIAQFLQFSRAARRPLRHCPSRSCRGRLPAMTAAASRPPAAPPIGAFTIGTARPMASDHGVDNVHGLSARRRMRERLRAPRLPIAAAATWTGPRPGPVITRVLMTRGRRAARALPRSLVQIVLRGRGPRRREQDQPRGDVGEHHQAQHRTERRPGRAGDHRLQVDRRRPA